MGKTLIILLGSFLFLAGCVEEEEDQCPNPLSEKHYLLLDKEGQWFEAMVSRPLLKSYSNNGMSESYDTQVEQWIVSLAKEDCVLIKKEIRRLMFNSSLYQRNFLFEIRRELGGDILKITAPQYYRTDGYIELFVQNPKSCVVYSTVDSDNLTQKMIPVAKIDSITVKSKTYRNVFKIDLGDFAYNIDERTKVFYFTSENGLIGFETFDGEEWYLY